MKQTCSNCGKVSNTTRPGQFWILKNYYGMNGKWCADCYDLISHDAWGSPKNPTEYLMILLKQEKGNGKKA